MKKLLVLLAGGIGYVLGTKAGQERYQQILGTFNKVKEDPRVQQKAQQATDLAKEKAPTVKDKVSSTASSAASKAQSSGESHDAPVTPVSGTATDPVTQLNPDSTIFQDEPGPKGTLP